MIDNPIEFSLGDFLAGEGRDPLQAPPSFTRWMQAVAWAGELYEPEMCGAADTRTTITYGGRPQPVLGIDGRYGLGVTDIASDGDSKNRGFAVMGSIGFPVGQK